MAFYSSKAASPACGSGAGSCCLAPPISSCGSPRSSGAHASGRMHASGCDRHLGEPSMSRGSPSPSGSCPPDMPSKSGADCWCIRSSAHFTTSPILRRAVGASPRRSQRRDIGSPAARSMKRAHGSQRSARASLPRPPPTHSLPMTRRGGRPMILRLPRRHDCLSRRGLGLYFLHSDPFCFPHSSTSRRMPPSF